MKLIRFGTEENEKPGIQLEDKRLDVSAFGEDYNEKFFETNGIERLKYWIKKYGKQSLPFADIVDKYGLYVPNHPGMGLKEVDYISEIINKNME